MKNKCYIMCMHAKSLKLSPTLCYPRDGSSPGSSVHGILQARILEWGAMPSARGSFQPRDQTHISYMLILNNHRFQHTE